MVWLQPISLGSYCKLWRPYVQQMPTLVAWEGAGEEVGGRKGESLVVR